jgi:hypothetical protein
LAGVQYPPDRAAWILRFTAILCGLAPTAALAALRVFGFPPDAYSAIGLPLLVIALIGIPVVVSRLWLLFSISYRLNPGGAFEIRFGTRFESIPVEAVEEILAGARLPADLRSSVPGWWRSWSGRVQPASIHLPVDCLATQRDDHLLLVVLRDRMIAISPANPAGFMRAFSDWATRGSIEPVPSISVEPPPVFMDILDQAIPASLLGVGLVAAVSLGSFILAIQPGLPAIMPFKFSVSGAPIAPGNPIRLLILPITGGLIWIANAMIGWIAWRRDDRLAAYTLWSVGLLVPMVFWFAAIGLILNK